MKPFASLFSCPMLCSIQDTSVNHPGEAPSRPATNQEHGLRYDICPISVIWLNCFQPLPSPPPPAFESIQA